jgi:hypothetical protein
MYIVASYIIGFPDETAEDLNLTLKSMIRDTVNGIHVQLTVLSLLPGTPLYEDHSDELKYDGIHSTFSSIELTPETERMILDYPDIFSSFYYLPGKYLSRETQVLLAGLSRYLEHFIPSFSVLGEEILRDMEAVDVRGLLEERMARLEEKDKSNPSFELIVFIELLKEYLQNLSGRNLPPWAPDIAEHDIRKAILLADHNLWKDQQIRAGRYRERRNAERWPGRDRSLRIRKTPSWVLLHTRHYIYDFVLSSSLRSGRSRLRKGRHHYFLLAVSERIAQIHKIPRKELPVYEFRDGESIEAIVRKSVEFLPEDRILHIIRRMFRLGMIEICEASLRY